MPPYRTLLLEQLYCTTYFAMVVPNPPHQGNFGKTRFQTVVLSAMVFFFQGHCPVTPLVWTLT
jgi:hypothetical protein